MSAVVGTIASNSAKKPTPFFPSTAAVNAQQQTLQSNGSIDVSIPSVPPVLSGPNPPKKPSTRDTKGHKDVKKKNKKNEKKHHVTRKVQKKTTEVTTTVSDDTSSEPPKKDADKTPDTATPDKPVDDATKKKSRPWSTYIIGLLIIAIIAISLYFAIRQSSEGKDVIINQGTAGGTSQAGGGFLPTINPENRALMIGLVVSAVLAGVFGFYFFRAELGGAWKRMNEALGEVRSRVSGKEGGNGASKSRPEGGETSPMQSLKSAVAPVASAAKSTIDSGLKTLEEDAIPALKKTSDEVTTTFQEAVKTGAKGLEKIEEAATTQNEAEKKEERSNSMPDIFGI